jgi:RimJ/RimL family protein N-acetyltransferase
MAWYDEPQPTLRTARLLLRPWRPDEGARVEELAGAWEIADTTARIPHPYPAGGGSVWIGTRGDVWSSGAGAVFAIALAETDEPMGTISLEVNQGHESAELGYFIGVPYWNRGYTTEAARGLIDYGFEQMGLNRIVAFHMTRNPASGRVMEKAGMTFEGVLRQAIRRWDVYEDMAIRSILRSEWEAGRLPTAPG